MPAPASTTLVGLGPDFEKIFLQAGVITAVGTPEAKSFGVSYHFVRKNREHPLVEKQYNAFTDLVKRWDEDWKKAAGDKAIQDKLKAEFVQVWRTVLKVELELLREMAEEFFKVTDRLNLVESNLAEARDQVNAAEEKAKKAEESVKKVLGVEEAAHHGHDDHGHHGPEPTEKKGRGKWFVGLGVLVVFLFGMFAYWLMFDKTKAWKEDSIAANVKLNSCLKERDGATADYKNADAGFIKVMTAVGVKADGKKTYDTLANEMVEVCTKEPEPPPAPDYIVERWKLNFVDGFKSRIVGICPHDSPRPQLKKYDESEFDHWGFQWFEVKCLEE